MPKSQKICRIPFSIWYENPKQIIIKKNLQILCDKKLINDKYANSPINKQLNQTIIRGKSNTRKNPDILCEIERTEVNCGLYICKCGEIGRLVFFIFFLV